MGTSIRPARATDASFLAWVMLAASRSHVRRGAWDLHVGGSEAQVLAFLERMAAQPEPSFCRWEGFLVAEVDGTPAAALSGYTIRDPGMHDPTPAIVAASRTVLGWGETELVAANARLIPFLTCVVEPAPEAWAVEWVATRPEFRRRGLVHELLLAVVDVGRSRAFRTSQILVLIGNTPAQCAYERAGYRVVGEKRNAEFARVMDCPGIAQLTRTL
jgi:ribosomal protein S18 acetylase RimI-like enzyme